MINIIKEIITLSLSAESYNKTLRALSCSTFMLIVTFALTIMAYNFGGEEPFIMIVMPLVPILAAFLFKKVLNPTYQGYYWLPTIALVVMSFGSNTTLTISYLPFDLSFKQMATIYLVIVLAISCFMLIAKNWNKLKNICGFTNTLFLCIGIIVLLTISTVSFNTLILSIVLLPLVSSSRSITMLPAYLSFIMSYTCWSTGDEGLAVFSLVLTLLLTGLPTLYKKSKTRWG